MERDKDLTGGDLAVGEESMKKNLGMRDLSGFMEEYKQKYKSENEEIDWARITNFGLMGGLFGSTLATLYWNKDASSKSYFFWGLMLGSCASAFLMWSFLVYRQLQQEGSSKYERDMAAKKEALRRKEQETFERHDTSSFTTMPPRRLLPAALLPALRQNHVGAHLVLGANSVSRLAARLLLWLLL